jgi:hypothetical protein
VTSDRKAQANRANAQASTGPKTAPGRARTAKNAFRHGLSSPVYSDPVWSKKVESLARAIAGTDANAEIQELARQVAEAQIDLRRVRCARRQVLCHLLSDPYYERPIDRRKKVFFLLSLLRPNAPDLSMEVVEKFVLSTPQGPEKFALILFLEAKHLLAMDRYERRALSQRRLAIRAFDEARRRTGD